MVVVKYVSFLKGSLRLRKRTEFTKMADKQKQEKRVCRGENAARCLKALVRFDSQNHSAIFEGMLPTGLKLHAQI